MKKKPARKPKALSARDLKPEVRLVIGVGQLLVDYLCEKIPVKNLKGLAKIGISDAKLTDQGRRRLTEAIRAQLRPKKKGRANGR